MTKKILTAAAAAMLLAAPVTSASAQNPFLQPYDTKYEIPPFEKIKTSDFIPAIKAGIEEQKQNIASIEAELVEVQAQMKKYMEELGL